ncbi:MAG: transporter substrate-binding domain-containing protein [Candidatus Malihini olakiniferum]
MEIELYKVLYDNMKVKCEIMVQPFASSIPALNAGKFDAISASFTLRLGQTFAVLKSSPLASLPNLGTRFSLNEKDEATAITEVEKLCSLLKGKTIGIQSVSIASTLLDEYFKGMMTVREYKTMQEHDLDLKAGRVDLVIGSTPYIKNTADRSNGEIVMAGPQFIGGILGSSSSSGLRKSDPELKAMFDKAIDQAKANGTIKKLSEKWFVMDTTPL